MGCTVRPSATPAAASWTAAGFVVALPAFPHTRPARRNTAARTSANQPEDAAFVIRKVRDLGKKDGDPLNGRIDGNHVAAIGHSAGGYTTAGMFNAEHDERLRAGVVLAGWLAPGAFEGPPATMLFLQGDSDPVVPIAEGRAAYDKVPWSEVLRPAAAQLPRAVHVAGQPRLSGDGLDRHGFPALDPDR